MIIGAWYCIGKARAGQPRQGIWVTETFILILTLGTYFFHQHTTESGKAFKWKDTLVYTALKERRKGTLLKWNRFNPEKGLHKIKLPTRVYRREKKTQQRTAMEA